MRESFLFRVAQSDLFYFPQTSKLRAVVLQVLDEWCRARGLESGGCTAELGDVDSAVVLVVFRGIESARPGVEEPPVSGASHGPL